MELELFQPAIARRSCADCQKYMTTDTPFGEMGDFEKDSLGNKIERPPMSLPICRRGKPEESKCPKGTPENPKTLSERNRKFWKYHRLVKASPAGTYPTDDWHNQLSVEVQQIQDDATEHWSQVRNENHLTRLARILIGK